MMDFTDPIALCQALIRCQSITPMDDGALDLLGDALDLLGFKTEKLIFEDEQSPPVGNLYARLGEGRPNFVFAGHTDVVPPGDPTSWSVDPFGGEIVGDQLYGRGAVDMKGAIACFVAAVARLAGGQSGHWRPRGSVSLLITGDEEGVAVNGTRKVLRWLEEKNEALDACLVGEPTNAQTLGDTIKIGRRGSLNARLSVQGVQGHVAYPERADNPIPRLMAMLAAISEPLDEGNAHFPPSSLVPTTIDVDNPAVNLIPAFAHAGFNIRFNDRHDAASLESWLRRRLDEVGGPYSLDLRLSGDAFVTPPGRLTELMSRAIQEERGIVPTLSTGGGTSDARFIKASCPVIEFGLVGQTMHQVDERVSLQELLSLARIYGRMLQAYFGAD